MTWIEYKKKILSRSLSFLLALAMVFSLLPAPSAFADEGDGTPEPTETTQQAPATEEPPAVEQPQNQPEQPAAEQPVAEQPQEPENNENNEPKEPIIIVIQDETLNNNGDDTEQNGTETAGQNTDDDEQNTNTEAGSSVTENNEQQIGEETDGQNGDADAVKTDGDTDPDENDPENTEEGENTEENNEEENADAGFQAPDGFTLVCDLEEGEEHTHTEGCYANLGADVEQMPDWERITAQVELTGNWALDLVVMADSQVGYTASRWNYIIENGRKSRYTRYGAWAGDPYCDWCAAFVSFCIHFADVEMPTSAGCVKFIEYLTDAGLYRAAKDHTPRPGDLVFFTRDNVTPCHVGIVAGVVDGVIWTIEGNHSNTVEYFSYDQTDPLILGYGLTPENPAHVASADDVWPVLPFQANADTPTTDPETTETDPETTEDPENTETDPETTEDPENTETDPETTEDPENTETDPEAAQDPENTETDPETTEDPENTETDPEPIVEQVNTENDQKPTQEPENTENDQKPTQEPENTENNENDPEAQLPAAEPVIEPETGYVLSEQALTDETGRVTVTGLLPVGATITARPLTAEEIEALALVGVRIVFAYDITIWVNGEEYQPTEQLLVQVVEEDLPDSGLTVSHIEKDENGDVTATPVESQVIDGDAYFAADSFSIYIGFTVEYHYDSAVYSVAGLSEVSLSDVFANVGYSLHTVSEAETVVFSNAALIAVTQTEDDWLLASLAPFRSTETLTITFVGGDILEITVTDDVAYAITLQKTPDVGATVTCRLNTSSGEEIAAAVPGTTVYVDITNVPAEYTLASIVWDDGNGHSDTIQPDDPHFSMPDRPVKVTVNFVSRGATVRVDFHLGFDPAADVTNDSSLKAFTFSYNNGGADPVSIDDVVPADGVNGYAAANQTYTFTDIIADSIALPTVKRFGYTFTGWNTEPDGTGANYTATHAIVNGEQFYAQWQAKTFEIRLNVGSGLGSNTFALSDISVNFSADTIPFNSLAANGFMVDGSSFKQSLGIAYGESLDAYFARLGSGYALPTLTDGRNDDVALGFETWTFNSLAVTGSGTFALGTGFLAKGDAETLAHYQDEELPMNPVTLLAQWQTLPEELTIVGSGGNFSAWKWGYVPKNAEGNDTQLTFLPGRSSYAYAAGPVQIPRGSTVVLAIPTSSTYTYEFISSWGIRTSGGNNVAVQEGYSLNGGALTYQASLDGVNCYLYSFVMPAYNVAATYNAANSVYVDLSHSPIVFAEGVSAPSGRTGLTGFWYVGEIEGMTPLFTSSASTASRKQLSGTNGDISVIGSYTAFTDEYASFYLFNTTKTFYVTSGGVPTQNQLVVINAITVHLKNCNLAARTAYTTDCVDDKIATHNVHIQNSPFESNNYQTSINLSDYANILVDLTVNPKYTVRIIIDGANTIGVIATDHLYTDYSHIGEMYVEGVHNNESLDSITLGTLFTHTNLYVKYLTLNELSASNSLYLVYSQSKYNAKDLKYTHVIFNAPHKWTLCGSGYTNFYSCNNSTIAGIFTKMIGVDSCDFHVLDSVFSSIHCLGLTNSRFVVDGSVIFNDTGNGSGKVSNSTLIVKGEVCDILGCTIDGNSQVLCNMLCCATRLHMSGQGILVTNVITGHAYSASWDSTNLHYVINTTTNKETDTTGRYTPFFFARSDGNNNAGGGTNASNKYSFLGNAQAFLLGDYSIQSNSSPYHDSIIPRRADAQGNPVKTWMDTLLDANGLYNGQRLNPSDFSIANTSNECFHVGTSTQYTEAYKHVLITIGGNATIKTAGNLTFMNDTVMTGGTVVCGGTFSSKRSLTVSGGSITATEIGNLYNFKENDGTADAWETASFSNCTLVTDRLGARSYSLLGVTSRSNVVLGDNVNLSPRTESTVRVVTDVYINYFVNGGLSKPSGNPATVRFTKLLPASSAAELTGLELCADDLTIALSNQSFIAPVGDPSAVWAFGSVNGHDVKSVGRDGTIYDRNSDPLGSVSLAYLYPQLSLYAVKLSYSLTMYADSGIEYSVRDGGTWIQPVSGTTYSVTAGNTITVTLDTAMGDRTVAWYLDPSGILRKVADYSVSADNKTITFTMPRNDADVYVTDELSLYLDLYMISFTDTGFAVDAEPHSADSSFDYAGNYIITETVRHKKTQNYIIFESVGSGNVAADGSVLRTITLNGVYEITDGSHIGVDIYDGAKVQLLVDGTNYLCACRVPENASFTLKGKTSNASSNKLYMNTNSAAAAGVHGFVFANGALGTATLQDLTLSKVSSSVKLFYSNGEYSSNTQTMKNISYDYYAQYLDAIGIELEDLRILGSRITVTAYNTPIFDYCIDVLIDDSSAFNMNRAIRDDSSGNDLLAGISGTLTVNDSDVTITDEQPDSGYIGVIYTSGKLNLRGDSSFTSQNRLNLSKLTMSGNASMEVGTGTHTGYLFCQDITINENASLDADYIFVSGYSTSFPGDSATLLRNMNAGSNIRSSGSLVINNGSVTANSFIGGDKDSEITVSGGTLTSPKIGTLGKYCGFITQIPNTSDNTFAYFTEDIPTGSTVNVSGGTVNVTNGGYLGGINSEVNISGGTVNLADGAVLGMTDGQRDTLAAYYTAQSASIADQINCAVVITDDAVVRMGSYSGSAFTEGSTGCINAPYGTVTIGDATVGSTAYTGAHTQVNVAAIRAEGDSALTGISKVLISGVTGTDLDNPYTGSEEGELHHENINLVVTGALRAQNIQILKGSVVYAYTPVAQVNVAGSDGRGLTVEEAAATRAYLYTGGSYGVIGSAPNLENYSHYNESSSVQDGKNIFGASKIVNVTYKLDQAGTLDAGDLGEVTAAFAAMPNVVTSYTVGSAEGSAALPDLSCVGYTFEGWYTTDTLQGEAVTQLPNNAGDKIYYAKWTRVTVPFRLYVTLDSASDATSDMTPDPDDTTGHVYYFDTLGEARYNRNILGAGGIRLNSYNTVTCSISEVMVNDSRYNGGYPYNLNASSLVTKAMVEAYINDPEHKPLKLTPTGAGLNKRNVIVVFDMNLTNRGRPVDAVFNNYVTENDSPTSTTATVIRTTVPVGETLLHGRGIKSIEGAHDALMAPTAPGYTFGGWYTTGGHGVWTQTDTAVTGAKPINDLSPTGQTVTLYAKWIPNAYSVLFAFETPPSEKHWITMPNEEPAVGAANVDSLTFTWTYDQAPADGLTYNYNNGEYVITSLPSAWKEGYVFTNWYYNYLGNAYTVQSSGQLNLTNIHALNTNVPPGGTILTLHPAFEPVKVTYHITNDNVKVNLNDGVFTQGSALAATDGKGHTYVRDDQPYAWALLGYADNNGAVLPSPAENTYTYEAQDADHKYGVVSTTAAYFSGNSNIYYDQSGTKDYRYTILRKGYTFAGWNTLRDGGSDTAVYGVPRFSHIDVYDQWTANTYNLNVYGVYEGTASPAYTSDFSSEARNSEGFGIAHPVSVTVDAAISGLPNPDGTWVAGNGPANDDPNGTFNTWADLNANAKRYLLGVTFLPLDPGKSTVSAQAPGYHDQEKNDQYVRYGAAITSMFSSGTLLQNNGRFFLPEDSAYQSDLHHEAEGDVAIVTGQTYSQVTIPDYPNGSTIRTYGVYRERSLVLVERYVLSDGEHRRIVYAGPWATYADVYDGDSNINLLAYGDAAKAKVENGNGLKFIGWYVNTQDSSGTEYPDYENDYSQWYNPASETGDAVGFKNAASASGVFDIMVYTVYVPQVVQEITLIASSDPTRDVNGATSTTPIEVSFEMPGSIQTGYMSIALNNGIMHGGFQLTTPADMLAHQYDESWTGGYTADNTVAITMTITSPLVSGSSEFTGCTETYDLSEMTAGALYWYKNANNNNAEYRVRAGDTVTLRLYHSHVMSDAAEHNLFTNALNTIQFRFDNDTDHTNGSNTLALQQVDLKIKVDLVNSLYGVTYKANLYENYDVLTITEDNDYLIPASSEELRLGTLSATGVAYSSIKNQVAPVIDGYSAVTAASNSNHPAIQDGSHIWAVSTAASSTGAVAVQMNYAPTTKTLTADADTLTRWTVSYTDGANAADASGSPLSTGDEGENVKYHSVVTITPSSTQYAEFITLSYGDKRYRLNDADTDGFITESEGVYSFIMPNANVTLSYNDVETLYLDDGPIAVTSTGYTQTVKTQVDDGEENVTITTTDVSRIWNGNYVIRQNSQDTVAAAAPATNEGYANDLSFAGDLSGRTVTLGNLKIMAPDSIELDSSGSTTVALTLNGSLEAANILAPASTALTMGSGLGTNADVTLSPVYAAANQRAAIGGSTASPASGAITLNNLNLNIKMDVRSIASGVGPGSQTASSASAIRLTNCAVVVDENNAGGDGDTWTGGAWIGGKGVSSVTLTGCSVDREASDAPMVGLRAVDGVAVTLNDSTVGRSDRMVFDPVVAETTLTLAGSDVRLQLNRDIGDHTMIGATGVGGTVNVQVNGENANDNSTIAVDYTSVGASTALFSGVMRIGDVNQNVTIQNTRVLEVSHGDITIHDGNYTQSSRSNVTHTGNYMLLEELPHPATDPALTVNAAKTVTISEPANGDVTLGTFTVTDDTTVILKDNLETNSIQIDTGKTLTVTANGHDMVTNSGVVTAAGHYGSYSQTGGALQASNGFVVGGDLTLNGVQANVSGYNIGSNGLAGVTTVSLTGCVITANTLGALGDQGSTFTFVAYGSNDNTLEGTVVADWYRLTYSAPTNMNTSALPTVLRTSQTFDSSHAAGAEVTLPASAYTSGNGVPAAPSENGTPPFNFWYILNGSGNRTQLTTSGSADTEMMTGGVTILSSATTSTELSPSGDGTKTLTIHAWSYTGDVKITGGHRVRDFSNGGASVTVQKDQAWTARLSVTGALTAGHDYRVTFKNGSGEATALPAGTDLTLTQITGAAGSGTYTYYYYKVPASGVSSVQFTGFCRMDTGAAFAAPDATVSDELFLLSADFSECIASAVSEYQVAFDLLLEGDSNGIPLGSEVTYTLTDFTLGTIALSGTNNTTLTVTTPPAGDSTLTDKHVYLVGTVTKDGRIYTKPTAADIAFNNVPGNWIAGDTVIFDLGVYGTLTSQADVPVTFSGLLPGTYSISWKLCTDATESNVYSNNLLRNVVSGTVNGATSKTVQWYDLPSLTVEGPGVHVYERGTAHTLSFTLTAYHATVTAAAEKQGAFASFDTGGAAAITISSPEPSTVTLPNDLAAGVYRIVFSIDNGSANDNVYYSFIVE